MFKNSVNSVEVNDIGELLGKIDLIDVREPYEYKSGHLPTAKNIPMDELMVKAEKLLDKSKEYHIICQSGGRSSSVCGILRGKGFNVVNVSGGTGRYRGKLER
jgi:rhodanese-related sulfurtransferase